MTEETKIIAIANHKGGVTKSSSCAAIGMAMAMMGKRVLLVDLDAQADLTNLFNIPDDYDDSIYNALSAKRPQALPVINVYENVLGGELLLSPSSLDVSLLDMVLFQKMEREKVLQRSINLTLSKVPADIVLIDCPPHLGIIVTNALYAADEVIIPVTAEAMPLRGLQHLCQIVEDIQDMRNNLPNILGILVTRYDERQTTICKPVLDALRSAYDGIIFNTIIHDSRDAKDAPRHHQDIITYAPNSRISSEYVSVAKEILHRLSID